METMYPYRVAWHKPEAVEVSPESRRVLLEALEYEFPTSRHRLAGLCGLGDVTLRRGCRQLIREGVLTLKYGPDPDSGKACDLITPVCYPILPVLELSETYMIWRLCNTMGESVFATVRDRSGFCTPEDDLHALMGQVSTILRAGTCRLPKDIPMRPPVLLLPSPESTSAAARASALPRDPDRLKALALRVLDQEPTGMLAHKEAVAHELGYHPSARGAACVLHLRLGAINTATLLIREHSSSRTSPLTVADFGAEMSRTLQSALGDLPIRSAPWQHSLANFLASVCRFITPQLVSIESPDTVDALPTLQDILPAGVSLQWTAYALNTPSLAHRGALRYARRALWECMAGKSRQAAHE